jgi:hypothetical protein
MEITSLGAVHRPGSARRIASRLLTTLLAALNLAGCGSLYLHSDETKQATAEAKAELDKVNLAAVFDNEAAYLDGLQQEENAAVAESLGAQRDRLLLTMLQGQPADRDARQRMASLIDRYSKAVAGVSDRGKGAKLWQLIDDARGDVSDTIPLAKALAEAMKDGLARIRAAPEADDRELLSPSGTTLDEAIAASQNAIDERKNKEAAARKAQEAFKNDLKAATEALAAGKATQATFTDLLTKFNDFLKKAKTEANPYIGEYVSESLVNEIADVISVTDPKDIDQPSDSKARAAIGFVHAAFGAGDAFSDPPRVPHPNAIAVAQAWFKYVASQASADLAQAQALEAVVHARLEAVTEQVYYLSRAGDALTHISKSPAPADGAGFSRLLTSAATKQQATAALHYFASAWTKGFIPDQQLKQVAGPLIERRAKLQQSRHAGEAWLGTLKPAVATLAAYGEGGIDPHLIAELLQVLGIAGIAVGVN